MGMEPFVAADDNAFGHLIGSIPDPIKNLREAIAFKVGLDQEKAQTARFQADAQEKAQEVSRAQMFQNDLQAVQKNPDASAVSALIMKYPEFADKIKSGWDVKDKAAKDADLTQLGELYSAAANGNWQLALKQAQARVDADKAAGQADQSDQAFVDQIQSAVDGNPEAQKAVLTSIGTHLAAVAGPEHFASVYGALKGGYTLDAGATRYDENGHVVAQSPFIKGNDGAIFERDGANATPPFVPPSKTEQPGGDDGFNTAVATVLKHEGGYNPHDINGAPVNFGINQGANPSVDVKNLTQDEAAQIYKQKYWGPSGAAKLPASMQAPYFDTYIINPKRAQQFLKASGNDPNRFMTLRENWMQSLAKKDPAKYGPVMKGWANRNADLRLTIAGTDTNRPYYSADSSGTDAAPPGYHTLIPGKQPSKRVMTDAEAQAKGLPPTQKYEIDDKTGDVSPIPNTTGAGDTGGPLKPKALEAATIAYAKTGKMPAGMGGQQVKNQILNYLPTVMDRYGLTPDDIPSIQQQFQADAKAYSQRNGQLSYMRQSLGKLNQHAQDLSKLVKAIPLQGNFTPFNWITQKAEGMVSNSTLAQLRGGLPLFEGEVARVMTGNPNSGAGQLSDDARHEFDILHSTQAPAAKIDAMNRIMKMVEETVKSTRDETGGLRRKISGGLDSYAGAGTKEEPKQDESWITLPSGLKIRKVR